MRHFVIAAIAWTTWLTLAVAAPNESTPTNGKTLESGKKALKEKQISGNSLDGKSVQEIYGGIVTDQTITVAGQDFYQQFVAHWREKPMHERYAIAVRERPSARWGNEIWVEFAQRKVFQAVLPANRSNVKALAEQAVEITFKNVVETEVQRLMFRDPDVAPDEL